MVPVIFPPGPPSCRDWAECSMHSFFIRYFYWTLLFQYTQAFPAAFTICDCYYCTPSIIPTAPDESSVFCFIPIWTFAGLVTFSVDQTAAGLQSVLSYKLSQKWSYNVIHPDSCCSFLSGSVLMWHWVELIFSHFCHLAFFWPQGRLLTIFWEDK